MSDSPSLNLVPLTSEREACKASAIERLEYALERARRGEVFGVAIATVGADGASWTTWSQNDQFPALLGSVHIAAARMTKQID